MAFKTDNQRKAAFANMNRTRQAVSSDNSKRAANTLSNTPENIKEWKENPRRIDIEGIDTPTIKGQSINNKKDNSRLGQDKPKEKSTMENKLKIEETKLMQLIKELSEHRANHKDDVAGYKKRHVAATEQQEVVRKIEDKIRESKQKMMPSVPGSAQYSPSHVKTAEEVAVDRAHAKMRQDTEAWEKKHDRD